MAEKLKLTCLECAQVNAVPAEKLASAPKCGICGAALMPGKPLAVDFNTLLKAARTDDVPLLVDFWAPWCGPCRSMAPEFEKAASMLKGEVRLAKIDTEQFPDASARWNIRGIPALIAFRKGREVTRAAGARPAQAIADFARQAMGRQG